MTTSLQPISLRPARTAVANAARHVRAAVDGSDDGKQQAFDDLLTSSSAPGDPRKEQDGVRSEVPIRPKPERDPLEDRQAAPPTNTICEATPLAALAMPLNQAALAASASKAQAADDEKSQPPEQAPDDAQIRTAPATVATVPTSGALKPGNPFGVEPHGPPVGLDDELPTDADPAKTVAPKIPNIRPHGSPVQPVENPAQQVKAADKTGEPVASVEPHGPPSVLPDELPPQPTGGMAKGEFTTTIPNPITGRAETAPVVASARLAVEQDAASLPPATASGQVAAATPVANPALSTVATPVAITTAAQLPANAGVVATPTDEEWSAETSSVPGARPANPASRVGSASSKSAAARANKSSQDAKSELLTHSFSARGTSVAKRQAAVTSFPLTPDVAERTTLPRQDAAPFASFGESRDKDYVEKPAAFLTAAVATTLHATGPVATAPTAETATPASGIVEVDKVESLLQAVQQTAEKVRLDGHGQMELRVRLGGADDVTVQVRVDGNAQPQITFQTNSPELRQALERGWGDLAATSSKTSVSEARFAPTAAAANTPSHSSAPFLSAQPTGHRPAHRWSSWA